MGGGAVVGMMKKQFEQRVAIPAAGVIGVGPTVDVLDVDLHMVKVATEEETLFGNGVVTMEEGMHTLSKIQNP